MASVAVGVRNGVAKRSKLTMVRASNDKHNGVEVLAERWIDSLAQVYDAVKSGNEQGKAVVSMSWGLDRPRDRDYEQAIRATFTKLLKALINDLQVPALAAAGNNAFRGQEIDTIPAILGESEVKELIVVGGVDIGGSPLDYLQRSEWLNLYALGEDVDCATLHGREKKEDGTSPGT